MPYDAEYEDDNGLKLSKKKVGYIYSQEEINVRLEEE